MTTQELAEQLILTINGQQIHLKQVSPTQTLLHYLQESGRTGTKEGCGDGDCGACTVVLVGGDLDGQPIYQAVNSCLIPLGSLAGREVITVEGISNGQLHPVQLAMVETGGSQCGYCTPGFVMSMFAAYYNGVVDDAAVEGNLCRCTGYVPIRRAAQLMANPTPCDHFTEKLQHSVSLTPLSYITNDQEFYRPTELEDVFSLLQQHPTATLIAGGTDLGLEMSHHRQSFPVLISLEAIAELHEIHETADVLEIGAAVPLSQIENRLHGIFPSLDEMLHWFAARQVKNRATLGGNIGTASPIGDLPPVLLSLDAQLRIGSASGQRTIALAEFFKGYRMTDLQAGEVIVSVRIPKTIAPGATRRLSQSYKIGKRGTDDISIVAAAFTIDLDGNNQIVSARLAYGGVAATPVRAIAVEEMLLGQTWNAATVQAAKAALKDTFTPLTDLRGSAAYCKLLIANLFEKFFVEVQ
ncbi:MULTISPECIES: xanthine dehydrogenase small subunit [unclassified Leptolyngbya]|uniref:xanthine dehydrogenase small subunit n=1 Tax=unclassified Leptolyngbya TaxID=2650499 RepID=UPI001686D340|nr:MULTISPECIES: xanthine dehydrogenase small subunit [unclassified Leptolyngbya]MBD1914111.1 xanthine dehydrogenase small subunit [Leptolyngbya sp. FACHB-8]MBD2158148.1 xanthine dehydrogenase small subunit [Leptolyngbya sp. FACHB-16]